jgi:hypothetical protein
MKIPLSTLGLSVLFASGVLAGAAQARNGASLAGKTYRFWGPQHGAQILYVGPRGLWSFLWYPGNRVVVASQWRPTMVGGVPAICHLPPARSYNPATGRVGALECVPQRIWASQIVEVARGDIFGLAHNPGTAFPTPFPLPRDPLSFSQLKRLMASAAITFESCMGRDRRG